jgi:hypothetical protein
MYASDINLDNFQIGELSEIDTGIDLTSYTNFEIQDHLDEYFRFFGSVDTDIIYMYFISNKRQNDLSILFDKTQPAISYDVNRLKEQVEFVMYMVSVFDIVVEFLKDEENGLSTYEVDLMLAFFFSTSFIKTAKIMNAQQVTIRCQVNKTIDKIKQLGHSEMYQIFQKINCNLNKVKKNV